MKAAAGDLLREARLRHGLSQESLAIRAGTTQTVVSGIERGRISPRVDILSAFLALLGEDLVLGVKTRVTGIDATLNQGNLELSPECRVRKGLAFADLVRQIQQGGTDRLGHPLQLDPILSALDRHGVDFVVIGSIAGLVHGSAYPTYDLDVFCAGDGANLGRLASALNEIGIQVGSQILEEQEAFSFDTEFGNIDILCRVHGVESYEQLLRDSSRELIAGVSVRIASLDHLIAMKRAANRAKDQLMVMEYVELADEIRKRETEGESS